MKKVLQTAIAIACGMASVFSVTSAQVYQQGKTTKGRVEMATTNYGVFGLDASGTKGAGFWPRGSDNQYIFGGGIWFAALKLKENEDYPRKLVSISFNPNTGKSWTVPGRIEDGPSVNTSTPAKYGIQSSVNYTPAGAPVNSADQVWPMWNKGGTLKQDANFGSYVYNINQRSSVVYPQGAAFIADEDIVSVFKDTDLSRYEDTLPTVKFRGYPLGIQYEQTMYSWDVGTPLQDVIVIRYLAINMSSDTLRECYLAPVIDADLAIRAKASEGAQNDRTRFFSERPDLQTAVQWTQGNQQEAGKGFGYLGVTLLETPAVDSYGKIRRDKPFYPFDEQIGMYTFRNWTIDIDPQTDDTRYDFIAGGTKDSDNGPGDKRMLVSTGPFIMYPGDTARVAIGLIHAMPTGTTEASGTASNMAEVIEKVNLVRNELYSGSFTSVETENILKEQPAYISFKNDAATLYFKNESFKTLRAELFNALGERMMTIHNGEITASEISFKTSELPAGMYYCMMTSNDERMMLPLTIVR
jgi:hypothetical protein